MYDTKDCKRYKADTTAMKSTKSKVDMPETLEY